MHTSNIFLLKNIGYNFTRLPNQFNHETQEEVNIFTADLMSVPPKIVCEEYLNWPSTAVKFAISCLLFGQVIQPFQGPLGTPLAGLGGPENFSIILDSQSGSQTFLEGRVLSRFLILLANSGAAAIKTQYGLQQPNKQTNNIFPQRQTIYARSSKGLVLLLHVAHVFLCLF